VKKAHILMVVILGCLHRDRRARAKGPANGVGRAPAARALGRWVAVDIPIPRHCHSAGGRASGPRYRCRDAPAKRGRGGRVRGFEVCEWRRGGLEASRMASSGVRQSESTAHGRVQRQTRGIAAEGALATGGRTQVTGAMEAWCSFEEEKTRSGPRERLND
jgi:hypothetical protein